MIATVLTPSRKRRVGRWVRSVPGYHRLTSSVLQPLRRHRFVNDAVWRLLAPEPGAGHFRFPFRGGRLLRGPDADRLPVIGFVATGLNPHEASLVIDVVADLQSRLGTFRPLLVLDHPVFEQARKHGYVLEVLRSSQGFRSATGTWEDYYARRLADLIDYYHLWYVVDVLPGPRISTLAVRLITELQDKLPPDLQVHRTTSDRAMER